MLWIKRLLWLLIVIVASALAVLISALNTDTVHINLSFVQLDLPLGVTMFLSLLAGLLLGLFIAGVAYVLPLKARNRRLQRQLNHAQTLSAQSTSSQAVRNRHGTHTESAA